MILLRETIVDFCHNESGATSIEYGLISALVGLGVIGGAQALGDNLKYKFYQLGHAVSAGASPTKGVGFGG